MFPNADTPTTGKKLFCRLSKDDVSSKILKLSIGKRVQVTDTRRICTKKRNIENRDRELVDIIVAWFNKYRFN